VLAIAAVVSWSVGPSRAVHTGIAPERLPEAGERQRKLVPARPALQAMFRVRQPDGSFDSQPPVAVVAVPAMFFRRPGGTGDEVRTLCSPTAALSVGYCPRGPPRVDDKPSSPERT
jgi:hypothetical protein